MILKGLILISNLATAAVHEWFCWFKEPLGDTPICSPEDPERVSVPLNHKQSPAHGPDRRHPCLSLRDPESPLFGSGPFKHSHGQSSTPRDLVGDTPIQKQS